MLIDPHVLCFWSVGGSQSAESKPSLYSDPTINLKPILLWGRSIGRWCQDGIFLSAILYSNNVIVTPWCISCKGWTVVFRNILLSVLFPLKKVFPLECAVGGSNGRIGENGCPLTARERSIVIHLRGLIYCVYFSASVCVRALIMSLLSHCSCAHGA